MVQGRLDGLGGLLGRAAGGGGEGEGEEDGGVGVGVVRAWVRRVTRGRGGGWGMGWADVSAVVEELERG